MTQLAVTAGFILAAFVAVIVLLWRELMRADDLAASYRVLLDKHHIPYEPKEEP